ncbi:hypothetical protein OIU74_019603 [Salix koriyanagi]|uniref:PROP1-like PPR domain-containing protein n=1 Tax=Salix koriyanagi TaxID=2511006 RepID=A0A9Q0P3Y3_9ROSI|nr:hypothetical protein OIU74_019603 [Salix koriyanagi]
MNLKRLVNRQVVNNLSRFNGRVRTRRDFSTITASIHSSNSCCDGVVLYNFSNSTPILSFNRYMHTIGETKLIGSSFNPKHNANDIEEDETMNEFLSRFVWIMRGKLTEVYKDCDKQTINNMLLVIVGKVVSEMEKGGLDQMLDVAVATLSQEFSRDLWKTVFEVSNAVLADMEKEKKKEKMKGFLQCEEVQELCRFAAEIGIRGDMMREFRFKWAREKMEESDFYESLKRLREEVKAQEKAEEEGKNAVAMGEEAATMGEEKPKLLIESMSQKSSIWPEEPKPISGKCKIVAEKILALKEEDDPSPLLAEWAELQKPSRIDWLTLLDKLKEQNTRLYPKVEELLLSEKSFQANIRDYSKIIDAHAKQNRIEDAERIVEKMNENGIQPDALTTNILVHMYSKAGSLDRAREALESLRRLGFRPDREIYNSMIMVYVNAGQPKLAESLTREMEARDIKPTMEIYMALLRSFSQHGDVGGAGRIATTMQFAGFQPNLESCTLLVETFGQVGDPDQARNNFDYLMRLGHKPDDRCTAGMIAAYEKKNMLDKALKLLLELEKDGFEPGLATDSVLVDWLGKLQLVDEVEQLLGRIAGQGEAPPLKIQVSLCDMYARAGFEKKALQALGVVEAKKEQLGLHDFERVVGGLIAGGFVQEARRVHGLMEAQGFASEHLKVTLTASQAFSRKRPSK